MNIRFKRFFLGIGASIILFNLVLMDNKANEDNYNMFIASFNKIDGVDVGTDVMISGIKVGQVKKIFLYNNYPNISLLVNKDINITDDSSVSIQTDGLFGKKFLLIEIGGSDKVMENGERFSFSEDSIIIEELLQKIIEIGENNKEI
ncbi:MAG: MlaD family protein [Alphaproteobacteria bacterium]|tara:strand:- start:254 stop:694 length:441 start_codon:yes stop_codon:yes gene_type:complete